MDEQDSILSNDLGGTSLRPPLMAETETDIRFTVKEVKKTAPSEKGTVGINIKLETQDVTKDVNGKDLKPGFPAFDYISITPTEKYDQDMINRRLKTFRKAVTGKDGGAFLPLEQYVGGTVRANVKIQKGKDGYDDKNVLKYKVPQEA